MSKKAASLTDSLLAHRPRKGEAKPQSEMQAEQPALQVIKDKPKKPKVKKPPQVSAPRRRRARKSPFTSQLNLKVRETDVDRFIEAAEKEDMTNGEFFGYLMDIYNGRN